MADGEIKFVAKLDNSELERGANSSKKAIRGVADETQRASQSIDNALKNIGKAVAGAFAVDKLKDFAMNVAKVRGEFQQLEIAFGTMLGSKSKADALMGELIKTAAITPFNMSDVANGAKQLLAFGVEAKDVNETLTRLGDIAAGLSIPLNDLVYLYGTTMTQGQMFTQDLRQFMGRGIPLAEELAKQFGVAKEEVGDLVSAGKVGAEEFKAAIWSMTDEGSKFGGLMEAQSKSITGQISNIEDAIEQMFNDIGKESEGVISDILGFVGTAVEHWKEIAKVIGVVIVAYGSYKAAVLAVAAAHKIAAIGSAIQGFRTLASEIGVAKAAMQAFNTTVSANPIGLVVSLVATAATVFGMLSHSTDDATQSVDKFGKSGAVTINRIKSLKMMVEGMTPGQSSYNNVIDEINELFKEYNIETLDLADSKDVLNEKIRVGIEYIKMEIAERQRLNELEKEATEYETALANAKEQLRKDLEHAHTGDTWNFFGLADHNDEVREHASALTEIFAQIMDENMDAIKGKTGDEFQKAADEIYQKMIARMKELGFSDEATNMFTASLAGCDYDNILYDYINAVEKASWNNEQNTKTLEDNAEAVRREADATLTAEQRAEAFSRKVDVATSQLGSFSAAIKSIVESYGQNYIDFTIRWKGVVPKWIRDKGLPEVKRLATFWAQHQDGKSHTVNGIEFSPEDIAARVGWYTSAASIMESEIEQKKQAPKPTFSRTKGTGRTKSNNDAQRKSDEAKRKAEQAQREKERLEDEKAEREQNMREYRDELIMFYRDSEFEIRQARIDAMEEGYEKEAAQIQLNYEKGLADIKDEEKEMVKELVDFRMEQWRAQHPKATKKQELEYYNSIFDPMKFMNHNMVGDAMNRLYNGSVDARELPMVEATELIAAGWKNVGDEARYAFSQVYNVEGSDGVNHSVLITPILPDGRILSPDELKSYIDENLKGSDLKTAGRSNDILIGVDVEPDAAEYLEKLARFYHTKDAGSPNGLTMLDLSQGQQETLNTKRMLNYEKSVRDNKSALDEMLNDFLSYNQRREKIKEEYDKKRETLYNHDADGNRTGFKDGVTIYNLDELNAKADEAMSAVDEEFAQRSAEYQAWCNVISEMSLSQLKKTLEEAEAELAEMERKLPKDNPLLAQARAQVVAVRKRIDDVEAEQAVRPPKDAIQKWEDLRGALEKCQEQFDAIGDAVGGLAGEIISTASEIMSSSMSMISGIVQLANWAVVSEKMAAEGASTALQQVEKASVILTIISAAMQIAMKIASLFNGDNKKQKEIDALQERIDQLQWEVDNANTLRYTSVADAIYKIQEAYNAANKTLGKTVSESDRLDEAAKNLAKTYANLRYSVDKALGADRYKQAGDQMKNLAQQQLLIYQQMELEKSKKKTDDDKIREYEQKLVELEQQMQDLLNDAVEDIMGNSAADMAKELGDAFVEAFQNGENAAEKWGEKVDEIVSDIVKRMLIQEFLEQPLGALFDKYRAKWFPDGMFTTLGDVRDSMPDFANELKALMSDFEEGWLAMPDEIKNLFSTEASREASQKGIATASQDSIDELNARMTTIQSHTYSICENQKILVSTTNRILESVVNIDHNTDDMKNRMVTVERNVREVKDTLQDISMRGIKLLA